jgi:hypothetical protein
MALGVCRVDWLYCLPAHPRLAALFTGLARSFCANFLRLLNLGSLVNTFFKLSFDYSRKFNQRKISKQPDDSKRVAEPELLVFTCSGLGLGTIGSLELLHRVQTLGLRSGLPSTLQFMFQLGSGAKLTSLHIQSTAGSFALQPLLLGLRECLSATSQE